MQKSHCESKTFTIEQLYQKYQCGELLKPQMQRSACWHFMPSKTEDRTNNYDFIKFITQAGNLVNPLIMLERIHNNTKKLFMVDGNNRLNAIINFIKQPLKLMGGDFLSVDFLAEMRHELSKISLFELLDNTSLTDLCEIKGLNDILAKNEETFPRADMIRAYKETISRLKAMAFMTIEVPITKFEGLTDKQLVELYAGLNRTGVKLTEQDILASTTSFITYSADEVSNYNELRDIATKYYNNMNDSEVLIVDFRTDSLNLFEVITALKIKLRTEYSFLPTYGTNSQKLEFLFQWYRYLFGDFETKINIDEFQHNVFLIFNTISGIIRNMFVKEIKSKMLSDKKVSIGKQHMTIIFLYLYRNITNIGGVRKIEKDAIQHVLRNIYYIQILEYCAGKKIARSNNEHNLIFKGRAGLVQMADKIKKSSFNMADLDLSAPSREQFCELINYALAGSIEEPKKSRAKRKPVNKFYAMLLSEYFRSVVPLAQLENEKDVEHVIPFSSKFVEGTLGDIDRIGNLTLIDHEINIKRGNQRITDEFIQRNKLYNLAYPSEHTYNAICNDLGDIRSLANYNALCEKREQIFLNCLVLHAFGV